MSLHMPSPLHQTLVDLLRHAPELLPRLLAVAGATPMEGATVRVLDAVLDQIERRVDLAFEVTIPGIGKVSAGVEVQLTSNPDKLRSWPVYLTTLRTRDCPRACLLILTPDPRVAAWAARPIDLGPGNEAFRVHVIGPDQIPRITEAHVARRNPELGFLSALAHADADHDPELVRTALAGLTTLDMDRARSYGSVLLDCIDRALRAALEVSVMEEDNQPRESSVSMEFVDRALEWGRRALIEDEKRISLEEGLKRGWEVGYQEGKQMGQRLARLEARNEIVLGRREVLRRLLARAGLRLDADDARRIDECDDLATLDRWIDQAIGATSVAAALA